MAKINITLTIGNRQLEMHAETSCEHTECTGMAASILMAKMLAEYAVKREQGCKVPSRNNPAGN